MLVLNESCAIATRLESSDVSAHAAARGSSSRWISAPTTKAAVSLMTGPVTKMPPRSDEFAAAPVSKYFELDTALPVQSANACDSRRGVPRRVWPLHKPPAAPAHS